MVWKTFVPFYVCAQARGNDSDLKKAIFFYDEVYVVDYILKDRTFNEFISEWEAYLDPENRSINGKLKKIIKPLEYTFLEDEILSKITNTYFTPDIMNLFKSIDPDGNKDIRYKEGIILYSTINDLFMSYKNKISYFPATELVPIVNKIITKGTSAKLVLKNISPSIPDFSKLCWEELLEIRRDKSIQDLKKIMEQSTQNFFDFSEPISKQDITSLVTPAVQKELWGLVEDVKPKLPLSILRIIVSNIPTPFPNPIGLADDLESLYKEYNLNNKYRWLFYLLELMK